MIAGKQIMKKLILNNYKIKIISVLLACGLWWFINASQNPRTSITYPAKVKYVNLVPECGFGDSKDESVRVELTGNTKLMDNISGEKLYAVANLSGLKEGSHRVGVKLVNKTGLRARLMTRDIEVVLKPLKKIELPVELRLSGLLPEGYMQGQSEYRPMSARAYGDREDLKSVSRLVVKLSIEGKKRSFRGNYRISAQDPEGNDVTSVHIVPEKISVNIQIVSKQTATVPVKVVFKNPGDEKGYPDAYYLPEEVSLSGDEAKIKKIKAATTEPFDVSVCEGGGAYQLKMKLPEGVMADPPTVTFSCEPQKAEKKTITVMVRGLNLCDGCSVNFSPANVDVVLTGPADVVSRIDATEVAAKVDLLGLKPGEYEIRPDVHLNKVHEQVKLEYDTSPVKTLIARTGD